MSNPTINELLDSESFKLELVLEHEEVKDFVISQIQTGGRLILWHKYFQLFMMLAGLFFVTRPFILAINGILQPLFYLILAVVLTFTLLILFHECIHALAFKITGAPKVSLGWFPKHFIFYAEADRHVINRRQFTFIALAPLVTVQVISTAGLLATLGHPEVYFWIFIMTSHTLFCSGDINMLNYFYMNKNYDLYTFDVKNEKKTYFYRRKISGY